MKNFKTLFIITGLIVFIVSGFGQKNFKPGYIITNDNDTIYGLIKKNSRTDQALECEFKRDKNSELIAYKPNEINSYRISYGKYYISKKIKINGREQKIFLEFLVNGIVNLYYYKANLFEYYFIEKDSIIYKLDNDEIEKKRNEGLYLVNSNRYKGVLKTIFSDDKETVEETNSTYFSCSSLIKITENYHNRLCNDYSCINYTKSTKLISYCDIYTGYHFNRIKLKTSSDYDEYVDYSFGFNYKLASPKLNESILFVTGMNFSKIKFNCDFINTLYHDGEYLYRIIMNYNIVRIPIAIEYNFNLGKVSPVLRLSYNNAYLLNTEHRVYGIRTYEMTTNVEDRELRSEFKKYHFGLAASLGVEYRLKNNSYFFFSSTIERRKSLLSTNHILDYHWVNSVQFHIGYGFKF